MRMFWKNILRGVMKNRGSYIGAACIIAFGTFFYIGMMDMTYNLQDQLKLYYQQSNFADVFAVVSKIPEEKLRDIEGIKGIHTAFGRLTQDVRILSDQQSEIVTVHLMAYSSEDTLNLIHLDPNQKVSNNQIYLGKKMREAYGYATGTNLQLLIKGKAVDFTLSGDCSSAEYIYLVPPAGSNMPDAELYDIACVDKDFLEKELGMSGLVNELGFTLEPGYTYDDVRYALMDYLEPYGVKSLSERKEQASYKTVNQDISGFVVQAVAFMLMFTVISIFMLYVMLKKIVSQDRTLIGTMKAMGFHNKELTLVYLWKGAIVGAAGAVLAGLLAVFFTSAQLSQYTAVYSLPDMEVTVYWETRLIGLIVSIAAGVLAVYSGVRGIAKITPAEAMRPAEPSGTISLNFHERINRHLSVMHKIGLRSMVRNPLRSFVIALAIAFPFGTSAVLLSFDGILNQIFGEQFTEVHTYDIQLSLDHYVPYHEAVAAGMQLDGVVSSEAITAFPVQLTNGNQVQQVMLSGYGEDSRMDRIMDWNKTYYDPPDDSLILGKNLADKLRVKEGDLIEIYNPQLLRKAVKIPVKRVIKESIGGGCYLSAEGIRKYFNTDMISNQIVLKVQTGELDTVKEQLLKTNRITTVVDGERLRDASRMQVQSMVGMMNTFAIVTVVSGLILIYNILMINVRERQIEYGTLKILGVTIEEFRSMIMFEQIVYFLLGIIMGFPILQAVKGMVKSALPTDTMNIRVTVMPSAYIQAFILCLIILIGSSIVIIHKVNKIMPADVLKGRE